MRFSFKSNLIKICNLLFVIVASRIRIKTEIPLQPPRRKSKVGQCYLKTSSSCFISSSIWSKSLYWTPAMWQSVTGLGTLNIQWWIRKKWFPSFRKLIMMAKLRMMGRAGKSLRHYSKVWWLWWEKLRASVETHRRSIYTQSWRQQGRLSGEWYLFWSQRAELARIEKTTCAKSQRQERDLDVFRKWKEPRRTRVWNGGSVTTGASVMWVSKVGLHDLSRKGACKLAPAAYYQAEG